MMEKRNPEAYEMTVLRTRPRARRPAASRNENATFYGVPYEGYVAFTDALGERPVRVNYDNGAMEIMTISAEHDGAKSRLGALIEDLALELGIEIAPFGSTTFRSKRLQRGLEPDECYYVANEPKVRGKKRLDLRRDPPPDLVAEIDISYHDLDREGIYAAMGVPELWRFDGKRLTFWRLLHGRWSPIESSVAFSRLGPTDLERFLRMAPRKGHSAMRRAFRAWIRDSFIKRK
jgi:Uma2 family endonuclease